MQDEEKKKQIEEEHPPKKLISRKVPKIIWIIGGLIVLCILAGFGLGWWFDSSFHVFFVFAAILFIVEVFLVTHGIIAKVCHQYQPCILPAVALLLEACAVFFIILPFMIRELFVFIVFGFLLTIVAGIFGLYTLCDGKKRGRLGITLSLAAVLIPVLVLVIVILLLVSGVAILAFM